MRNIDDSILPVMIDFGGLSVYQCDCLQGAITEQELQQNCSEEMESDTRAFKDFTNIHNILVAQTHRLFTRWKTHTIALKTARPMLIFKQWKKRATEKRRQEEKMRLIGVALVRFWRFRALQRKLLLTRHEIALRGAFRTWKTESCTDKIRTAKVVTTRQNRRIKQRLMKKWKLRVKNKQIESSELTFSQRVLHHAFTEWFERHLKNVYNEQLSRITPKPRLHFQKWRNLFDSLEKRSDQFAAENDSRLIQSFFSKWKQRRAAVKRARTKRTKLITCRWTVLTARAMAFSRASDTCNLRRQATYWRIMLSKHNKIKKATEQKKLAEKRKKAAEAASEARVRRNSEKTACWNAMARWCNALTEKQDNHLVQEIRRNIVHRIALSRTFRTWISKAAAQSRLRNKAALILRKRLLLTATFEPWKAYSSLIHARATEYHRKRLAIAVFTGLKASAALSQKYKERVAVKHRDTRLMRRVLALMRDRVLIREEENEEISVASLLNQNSGVPVTKITYL